MDHPINVTFIRLIVLLPLLGAAINFLVGSWLQKTFGKRAISLVGCGAVILAFILALRGFFAMLGLAPENRFMLDDLCYWRFFAWLNLFTFAMLVLVLGDNLWLMFVGWEGVGLCSFALIGFWYTDHNNTTAGNKAFIVNRIGDWAFVVALYSLFAALASVGHPTLVIREVALYAPSLSTAPGYLGMSLVTFVTLLFFIGATGKSAQIPLYVWLPDAMAGPTPVSALIHAATMV